MTTEIKRLLADALEATREFGAAEHFDEIEKLKKRAEEAKAALVAGLDALTGAASVYLAEATFPATAGEDCRSCDGGHSVVHTTRCPYDAAEQALRDTLAAT